MEAGPPRVEGPFLLPSPMATGLGPLLLLAPAQAVSYEPVIMNTRRGEWETGDGGLITDPSFGKAMP